MKKLISLLLLSVSLSIQAQMPTDIRQELQKGGNMGMTISGGMFLDKVERLDECLLTVTYRLSITNDTLKRTKQSQDIQVLQIGKNVSKCFSYQLYRNDSVRTVMKKKGISENFPRVYKCYFPEDVYTYSKEHKVQVLYRGCEDILPFYWYNEETPQMEWSLSDETKTIIGYVCKKATCSFRGRNYTAWYALDIPLKAGPYKFGGLPGLILVISDADGEYNFTCIGLKKGNGKTAINRYSSKSIKMINSTREQVRKDVGHAKEDLVSAYIRNGKTIQGFKSGQNVMWGIIDYSPNRDKVKGGFILAPHDFPPEPYNPIEKE